jgi:hypothetical protein
MSPAMFCKVVDGLAGDLRGEVFMRADMLDAALTEAGYWDATERDYGQRHAHASAMLEYLKLAEVQGRREDKRLLSKPTTDAVM